MTGPLTTHSRGAGYRLGGDEAASGHVVVVAAQRHGSNVGPVGAQRAGNGNECGGVPFVAHSLRAGGHDASEDGTGRGTPLVAYTVHSANSCARERHAFETDTAKSLDTTGGLAFGQGGTLVAFGLGQNQRGEVRLTEETAMAVTTGGGKPGEGYPAVACIKGAAIGRALKNGPQRGEVLADGTGFTCTTNEIHAVNDGMTVRRLTPVECARLQGLPDWWLDIEPPLSDSKKYFMIGNGGAVPVVRWIANRLRAVEEANP